MKTNLRPLLVLFVGLSIITGLIYPAVIAGFGQVFFHRQAEGSFIVRGGHIVGSELIGQNFASPRYFWGRPSATSPMAYNAVSSGGSNLGPLNPALTDAIKGRIAALKAADPSNALPIPVDLVTASASGLDPDISVAAAQYQVSRVARERHLDPSKLQAVLSEHAQHKLFGFLGEERVNVLNLNLAVDELH